MNTRFQSIARSLLRARSARITQPIFSQAVCRIHSSSLSRAANLSYDYSKFDGPLPRVLPPRIFVREDDKNIKDFVPPKDFAETTFDDYIQAQDAAVTEGGEQIRLVEGKISPAVHALVARIGLEVEDLKAVTQILQRSSDVDRYSFMGEKSLELYAGEHFHLQYPNLHARSLNNLLEAYIGDAALTALGYEWGLNYIGSFTKLTDLVPDEVAVDEMGCVVKSLIGLLYSEKGAKHTRDFIHSHILSRTFDANLTLPLLEPKRMLAALVRKQGGDRPVARLLKESGRITNYPIFVVGIFSGVKKLGEGYGSSLQMAEIAASKDALRQHYLKVQYEFQLPSDTQISRGSFTPTPIGDTPAIE